VSPAKKGFIRRLLFIPAGMVTMGLENRTTIAQQEGEREGHVPPQPPPWRPDAAPGEWDTSPSRPHSGGCGEPARRVQRDHARAAQWRWRVGVAENPSQSTDRGRGGEARAARRSEEPRRRRRAPAGRRSTRVQARGPGLRSGTRAGRAPGETPRRRRRALAERSGAGRPEKAKRSTRNWPCKGQCRGPSKTDGWC
jgi:hypothetical protein